MSTSTTSETASTSQRKTALITGAAQGIGRAVALRLARDGCWVGVVDLKSQEGALTELKDEINALSQVSYSTVRVNLGWTRADDALQDGESRAEVIIADVTDVKSVKNMVDTAVRITGKLDIVRSSLRLILWGLTTSVCM